MDKVYVIFWTQGGNTGQMAQAVGDGVTAEGKEVVYLQPGQANVDDLKDVAGFAMGCPAMGDEVLEESEMEPFVAEVEAIVKGKTVALFGSYGWGDGQWMRDWTERMKNAGATVVGGAGVIAHEAPDAEAVLACNELGKALAKL
ncbi:MAG: flavodoxin [Lachnospiraceae bacterium]|nr:flavodoxin [Lachnospiraceae bacterium]MBO6299767.1 flavodoxin [Lachnospiraceae bacterium]MCR5128613.1 flavodoxin [Lachnospiraceae bacterium]